MTGPVADLYAGARTDSALFKAALRVEEVAAIAYETAARESFDGTERERALRFAEHEREHAAAFESMLFALTVPVKEHATARDLDELVPGLRGASRTEALAALAELEGAAISGHQLMARRLAQLDALRTVAVVMAGGAQHLVVLRRGLGNAMLTRAFESGL